MDESLLKEKLELLKRCIYEELNNIRTRIVTDSNCSTKSDGKGNFANKSGQNPSLRKMKLLLHQKSAKRFLKKVGRIRRYKVNILHQAKKMLLL